MARLRPRTLPHHRAVAGLARSEERYALAVRAANDGIWDWDLVTDTMYFSPRWHAILGRPQPHGDQPAATWFDLVHPADLERVRAAVEGHLAGRSPQLRAEHRIRHADGGWRWVLTRGLATRGDEGRPARMAGSMSDVTDRRLAELRLQHDALHDSLSGLPNRTLFLDRVHQTLQCLRRAPRAACAVLCMDVDRFKLVNDSLSHAVGDKLLVAPAARLATAVRPGDAVARLGGDEFAVLLQEIGDPAPRRHRAHPGAAGGAEARDHREHPRRRAGAHPRRVRPGLLARHRPPSRRFRDGLLVAVGPALPPGGRAEDRPQPRGRAGQRRGRLRGHHPQHRDDGPQPRPAGDRRGHRGPRPAPAAALAGMRVRPGHLFSPALSGADMADLLARWSPAEIVTLFSAA